MSLTKEKIVESIKNYLAYIVVGVMCVVYLTIDLIKFSTSQDTSTSLIKSVFYCAMAITITCLLRYQGILHGKADLDFIGAVTDYDKEIDNNMSESDRLDEWCEEKNQMRRRAEITKRLKYAHLSWEEFEKGSYEIPNDKKLLKQFKKKYSKKQLECIKWCNNCVVEIYSADYLTSEMIKDKKEAIKRNVSIRTYLTNQNGIKSISSIVTSIAFAFLAVGLADDLSWSNFFFSLIKVATWLGSGVFALLQSYLFIVNDYKDSIKDKTRKLKEFNNWCKDHPKQKAGI